MSRIGSVYLLPCPEHGIELGAPMANRSHEIVNNPVQECDPIVEQHSSPSILKKALQMGSHLCFAPISYPAKIFEELSFQPWFVTSRIPPQSTCWRRPIRHIWLNWRFLCCSPPLRRKRYTTEMPHIPKSFHGAYMRVR